MPPTGPWNSSARPLSASPTRSTRISGQEVRWRSRPETGRGTGDRRHPCLPATSDATEASRAGVPGRAQTVRAEEIERLALRDLLPDSLRCIANSRSDAGRQEIGCWQEIGSTNGPAWSKFGRLPIPLESAAREQGRTERPMSGAEIIFEVTEDELDGGFSATALGFGIHTQGDTTDELHRNVRKQSTVISTTA